jgi:guanylate kinase
MEETRPNITDIEAFRKALKNYQVSEHAKQVLAKTPFVALSGLAGGGRNSVIRRLVEKYNYVFAVSDTTRSPKLRDGRMEQEGVDYYFREETGMLRDIQNGEFIEAEIIHNQQVSGTSIREVERVIVTGSIPIHDFEYGGAEAVSKMKPDAVVIGLLPPSYDEWIRRFRGRETIHEQEFVNRLTTAKTVLEHVLEHSYFKIVINDEIDQCADDIREIVEFNIYTPEVEQKRRKIAEDILRHVNDALT